MRIDGLANHILFIAKHMKELGSPVLSVQK